MSQMSGMLDALLDLASGRAASSGLGTVTRTSLAAGLFQRVDLRDGRLDVVRVGRGHRLHPDRVRAADRRRRRPGPRGSCAAACRAPSGRVRAAERLKREAAVIVDPLDGWRCSHAISLNRESRQRQQREPARTTGEPAVSVQHRTWCRATARDRHDTAAPVTPPTTAVLVEAAAAAAGSPTRSRSARASYAYYLLEVAVRGPLVPLDGVLVRDW